MAGIPKPPELRQRRHDRNDFGFSERDESLPIPPPRDKWLRCTTDQWFEYWNDDLSSFIRRPGELNAVRRLFDYKDELERAYRDYRNERTSAGSTKQKKLSPAFEAMKALEKMILPLEDRFGLNAIARLRLGVKLPPPNTKHETKPSKGGEYVANTIENADIINLPGLPDAR